MTKREQLKKEFANFQPTKDCETMEELARGGDFHDWDFLEKCVNKFIQIQVIPAVIEEMLVEKYAEKGELVERKYLAGFNQCCALQKERADKIRKGKKCPHCGYDCKCPKGFGLNK